MPMPVPCVGEWALRSTAGAVRYTRWPPTIASVMRRSSSSDTQSGPDATLIASSAALRGGSEYDIANVGSTQ